MTDDQEADKGNSTKEETFLVLKYGENYESKVVDRWGNTADKLSEAETNVCKEWLKRVAGITPPKED